MKSYYQLSFFFLFPSPSPSFLSLSLFSLPLPLFSVSPSATSRTYVIYSHLQQVSKSFKEAASAGAKKGTAKDLLLEVSLDILMIYITYSIYALTGLCMRIVSFVFGIKFSSF